jgi:hypothetical protein
MPDAPKDELPGLLPVPAKYHQAGSMFVAIEPNPINTTPRRYRWWRIMSYSDYMNHWTVHDYTTGEQWNGTQTGILYYMQDHNARLACSIESLKGRRDHLLPQRTEFKVFFRHGTLFDYVLTGMMSNRCYTFKITDGDGLVEFGRMQESYLCHWINSPNIRRVEWIVCPDILFREGWEVARFDNGTLKGEQFLNHRIEKVDPISRCYRVRDLRTGELLETAIDPFDAYCRQIAWDSPQVEDGGRSWPVAVVNLGNDVRIE